MLKLRIDRCNDNNDRYNNYENNNKNYNNNNNNDDSNNNDNSKNIKRGTGRCDVKLRSNVLSTVCHAEDFPRRNIIFRNRTLRNILNIWVIT